MSGVGTITGNRALDIAEPVQHPAEAVDDIAVAGPFFYGGFDHLARPVQVFALFDPRITQIIEHERLTRFQFQGLQEIGFGDGPVLDAFVGDAVGIEQRPVLAL